jgi:S-adenosyl methyltransferase
MYDYLLGGKDDFEADRAAIAGLMKMVPNARTGARENWAFLGRAVRYLVAEAGVLCRVGRRYRLPLPPAGGRIVGHTGNRAVAPGEKSHFTGFAPP